MRCGYTDGLTWRSQSVFLTTETLRHGGVRRGRPAEQAEDQACLRRRFAASRRTRRILCASVPLWLISIRDGISE